MADSSKSQSQVEIKQQCASMASTFSTEMTADERVPFPFFRPLSQKRANTWIISLFVILHLGAFTVTMIVNDCWENSYGDCALKPLRRFSFQPLYENPLLGPSASTSVPSSLSLFQCIVWTVTHFRYIMDLDCFMKFEEKTLLSIWIVA